MRKVRTPTLRTTNFKNFVDENFKDAIVVSVNPKSSEFTESGVDEIEHIARFGKFSQSRFFRVLLSAVAFLVVLNFGLSVWNKLTRLDDTVIVLLNVWKMTLAQSKIAFIILLIFEAAVVRVFPLLFKTRLYWIVCAAFLLIVSASPVLQLLSGSDLGYAGVVKVSGYHLKFNSTMLCLEIRCSLPLA